MFINDDFWIYITLKIGLVTSFRYKKTAQSLPY